MFFEFPAVYTFANVACALPQDSYAVSNPTLGVRNRINLKFVRRLLRL